MKTRLSKRKVRLTYIDGSKYTLPRSVVDHKNSSYIFILQVGIPHERFKLGSVGDYYNIDGCKFLVIKRKLVSTIEVCKDGNSFEVLK